MSALLVPQSAPLLLTPRPFSPARVSGLLLWLVADRIMGLVDGDPVSTWADASGQGNNATQSTTAAKPLWKVNIAGGRPVVRFDGVDDYLTVANAANFDLATPTIFVVGVASAGTGTFTGKLTFAGGVGDANRRKLDVRRASSTTFSFQSGADSMFKASGTLSWSGFNVMSIVARGATDYTLAVNGTAADATTPTIDLTTYNTSALIIGAGTSGAEFLTGDIAEVVIYNRALSAAERKQVERYLGARYGVAIS